MTTPNDTPEPSLASAGSQPVAWAVLRIDGSIYDVYASEEEAKAIDEAVTGNHGVVPLCRAPQPTLTGKEREAMDPVDFGGLTDKEREAIETAIRRELAAEWYGGKEPDRVVALRGLLERTQ